MKTDAVACFDNPLKADRFTVVFRCLEERRPGFFMALSITAAGVGEIVTAQLGPQLGRAIAFEEMPFRARVTAQIVVDDVAEIVRGVRALREDARFAARVFS